MASRSSTLIGGKYELLREIGKGGTSVVYLAVDQRLKKQWAIKEIKKTGEGRKARSYTGNIPAEAELLKCLDHPAIPRIVDMIEERGCVYLVMDYVEGETLEKILRREGAQPQERVLGWAKQLCGALWYLHSRKPPVIYRDMKPGNIICRPGGSIKLVDFGIAREYKEGGAADTQALGTGGYAPPEQYGRRQTDVRSDIYALGMTLHHSLTGMDPRSAGYSYQPIRQCRQELSGRLEKMIDKCTAFDPKDRYQDCKELMHDISRVSGGKERSADQRRRKMLRAVCAAVLLLGSAGTAAVVGRHLEIRRQYREMLAISGDTPYQTKVETYLDAIHLLPSDTGAYRKLLETYREHGNFGEVQCSQFTAVYNRNKSRFSKDTQEYLDLEYETGMTYLYLYDGGDDSFRTRILKACPHFQAIVESEHTDYPYYRAAKGYRIVGEFYAEYLADALPVREPQEKTYEELLDSLAVCMEELEGYEKDDGAYVRLLMYRETANLLNDCRRGFARTGIEKKEVLKLLDAIYRETENLSVSREESLEIRKEIQRSSQVYRENLERAYENTAKRRG